MWTLLDMYMPVPVTVVQLENYWVYGCFMQVYMRHYENLYIMRICDGMNVHCENL